MPSFKFSFLSCSVADPTKGFEYLYLSEADELTLRDSVQTRPLEVIGPAGTDGIAVTELRHVITDVIGNKHGIGVENLAGSGKGQSRVVLGLLLIYVFTRFRFTFSLQRRLRGRLHELIVRFSHCHMSLDAR